MGDLRPYEFATTFYPLWAGIASDKQAQRVVQNLDRFEMPGGLKTSIHVSGNQWDAPFGWTPLQLFAVPGFRRYGYKEDADRLARKFIAMLVQEFTSSGTIVEKYERASFFKLNGWCFFAYINFFDRKIEKPLYFMYHDSNPYWVIRSIDCA